MKIIERMKESNKSQNARDAISDALGDKPIKLGKISTLFPHEKWNIFEVYNNIFCKLGITTSGNRYVNIFRTYKVWDRIKRFIYTSQYDTKIVGKPIRIANYFEYPVDIIKVRIKLFGITIKSNHSSMKLNFTEEYFKKGDLIKTA